MAAVAGGAFTIQRNKNSSTHKTLWVGFLKLMKSNLGRGLRNLWISRSLSYWVILKRILQEVYFLKIKRLSKPLEESVLFSAACFNIISSDTLALKFADPNLP